MRKRGFAVQVLALILLAAAGCSQKGDTGADPKKRLELYISQSFAIKSADDRAGLSQYLTGDAKVRLAAWSEDQFLQAFVDTKRQFLNLAIRETKQLSPKEVSLTYELSYIDQGKGRDAKVTNRKMAQLILENGVWYISDVRNIKELVEYRNEMSLP